MLSFLAIPYCKHVHALRGTSRVISHVARRTFEWKSKVEGSVFGGRTALGVPARRFRMINALEMSSVSADVESITKAIGAKGDEIRKLKELNPPTLKEDIVPLVSELLALKASYKTLTGDDFGQPPKAQNKKDSSTGASGDKKQKQVPSHLESTVNYERNRNYFEVESNEDIDFGDFVTIASDGKTGKKFIMARDIGTTSGSNAGDKVWIRGRVANVRAKGNSCFIVLRCDSFYTVQVCHFKDKENPEISKALIKFAQGLTLESIVDVYGTVTPAEVDESLRVFTLTNHSFDQSKAKSLVFLSISNIVFILEMVGEIMHSRKC